MPSNHTFDDLLRNNSITPHFTGVYSSFLRNKCSILVLSSYSHSGYSTPGKYSQRSLTLVTILRAIVWCTAIAVTAIVRRLSHRWHARWSGYSAESEQKTKLGSPGREQVVGAQRRRSEGMLYSLWKEVPRLTR